MQRPSEVRTSRPSGTQRQRAECQTAETSYGAWARGGDARTWRRLSRRCCMQRLVCTYDYVWMCSAVCRLEGCRGGECALASLTYRVSGRAPLDRTARGLVMPAFSLPFTVGEREGAKVGIAMGLWRPCSDRSCSPPCGRTDG